MSQFMQVRDRNNAWSVLDMYLDVADAIDLGISDTMPLFHSRGPTILWEWKAVTILSYLLS